MREFRGELEVIDGDYQIISEKHYRPGETPWDRLPGEKAKEYDAFLVYRDLGMDHRSLEKACNIVRVRKGKKERIGADLWVMRYSVKHHWVERVEAWDRYQVQLKDQEWQKRQAELREVQWTASQKLFKIGLDGLESLDSAAWNAQNILRAIELASTIGGQTKEVPLDKDAVRNFMATLPETLRIRVIQLLKGPEPEVKGK